MRVLNRLQGIIRRTYDLGSQPDVSEFLVTCPEAAAGLGLVPGLRPVEEQVLVVEDGENVDVAVYLNAAVLNRLRTENPLDQLHDGNLGDFWTVLEGVSHFVCLAWNAEKNRQVTQLELELQAEVDKFVTTALLVAAQRGGKVPPDLHQWLFELPEIDGERGAEEKARYSRANRYAGRYCLELIRRYLRDGENKSMMPELRRFYRFSQRRKIRHIQYGADAPS
ncbi:MAG: hypothetical protein ACR2QU_02805 [Gammaproteobacteria bacterium]